MYGGQSPHIAKREGNVPLAPADVLLIPLERRKVLHANTVRQDERRIANVLQRRQCS